MRWLRRRRRPVALDPNDPDNVPRTVPDDLPRDGLFAQPLHVARVKVSDPEQVGDETRVSFVVFIRDDEGRTCPDIAVDATIRGPERTASGQTATDLMGRATFRMTGPAGSYTLTVDDVAAGALRWTADDHTETSIEAGGHAQGSGPG
ncbi:MAG: hypothetical protein R3249_07745 [Nitriliruptorales bacterium]|nr:hypothetical protein [Nitriliruptorales bacterium]